MAENGELCFGTIETYLIWNLTEEKNHKTDATNASRTMLMNLETLGWDDSLLKIFDIPKNILPEICSCDDNFGSIDVLIKVSNNWSNRRSTISTFWTKLL